MSFLNQFTIRFRLYASASLLTLLLLALTALSVSEAQETRQELKELVSGVMRKQDLVADIQMATRYNARNTLELFVSTNEQRQVVRARMAKTRGDIDRYFKELDELVTLPRGRALLDESKVRRKAFVDAFTDASKVLDDDQAEATYILNKRVLPAIDALGQPLDELLTFQKELAHEREQAIMTNLDQQIRNTVALGVVAVLVSVLTAWSLMRSINRPLAEARQFADTLAKGDLTVTMAIEGRNELTELLEALDHMRETTSHVLMRIQQSAASVASASSQIAVANLDLSTRTEEQASALEQTAATMEELTSTVQSNAATTDTARSLAERANQSATEVGQLVRSMVEAMQGIHGSSERIRDIVSVIDSIAFQTNILALNAAVEAARAGEQGRGFAVVASEVRALAQRSAAAAQEIKGIIEDNVSRMEAGNREAGRAGEAVDEALRHIGQVNQTIAEVDHASKEQSTGIEQVGHAVQQMEQVTQQNAALVEETSAATKNLDEQVQHLKDQINRFRIDPHS